MKKAAQFWAAFANLSKNPSRRSAHKSMPERRAQKPEYLIEMGLCFDRQTVKNRFRKLEKRPPKIGDFIQLKKTIEKNKGFTELVGRDALGAPSRMDVTLPEKPCPFARPYRPV
ncbi:hypothetical protein NE562_06615 [Butyricicoccus faecihominis]|nr:hypothetical protein [Butyricicoccus faecihominis]